MYQLSAIVTLYKIIPTYIAKMDDKKDSQKACLEAIDEINADMTNVQKNVEEIGKLQKKILNAVRKDDAVQNMRYDLIDNITMLARRILLNLTQQVKVNETEINPLSRKGFHDP